MRRLVDLVKLDRLDHLIRRQATGSPNRLAERLELSRSSLFDLIAFLREEMKAPIRYSKNKSSYVYEYIPKFYLGFEKDRMQSSELYNTIGGGGNKSYEELDAVLNEDINFNDLYINDNY